jgi:hypothetical protein
VLVLSGLMIRRVGIEGRYGAELIGEGDLLRPIDEGISPLLPLTTDWSIIMPTRMAALDDAFEQHLAQHPELARCLVAARRPTVTAALSELTRRGLVRTDGETWVLPGETPSDLSAFVAESAGPVEPSSAGS